MMRVEKIAELSRQLDKARISTEMVSGRDLRSYRFSLSAPVAKEKNICTQMGWTFKELGNKK